MDVSVFALDAAGHAFVAMLEPQRLAFLCIGVVMGLVLGVLPGIGTTAGVAIMLPFTFGLDPYSAFAILLGLAAVTATGDPIPAIMFGVPGGAGSAATVLDGQPMAKRGEAGRALSAAYMASLLGGLVGAALLFVTIPVLAQLHPLASARRSCWPSPSSASRWSPSSPAPRRCAASRAACLGLMLSLIGTNPQTGDAALDVRHALSVGRPAAGVGGARPLRAARSSATSRSGAPRSRDRSQYDVRTGMLQGVEGLLPQLVADRALQQHGCGARHDPRRHRRRRRLAHVRPRRQRPRRARRETFGKGDVRGVIAVECSNNSKEAGQLVPAIAFGVPTTTSMALLIGAFLSHGLVPGPDMLTKHLDVTYSMVWSMAIANVSAPASATAPAAISRSFRCYATRSSCPAS